MKSSIPVFKLYTHMTISQISDYLGFSDATDFSRFFRRYTATALKDFRHQPVRAF